MSRHASPCIVAIDDDDYVRAVTEMVLADTGHFVRATANGLKTLRRLDQTARDLCVPILLKPFTRGELSAAGARALATV